jgi:hypothetical protein
MGGITTSQSAALTMRLSSWQLATTTPLATLLFACIHAQADSSNTTTIWPSQRGVRRPLPVVDEMALSPRSAAKSSAIGWRAASRPGAILCCGGSPWGSPSGQSDGPRPSALGVLDAQQHATHLPPRTPFPQQKNPRSSGGQRTGSANSGRTAKTELGPSSQRNTDGFVLRRLSVRACVIALCLAPQRVCIVAAPLLKARPICRRRQTGITNGSRPESIPLLMLTVMAVVPAGALQIAPWSGV